MASWKFAFLTDWKPWVRLRVVSGVLTVQTSIVSSALAALASSASTRRAF